MTKEPTIKNEIEKVEKNQDLTHSENKRIQTTTVVPTGIIDNINRIPDDCSVTDSVLLGKFMEHAIQIMQFVDGKENLFALGKVIIFGLFLGVS